ncbi:hypothetical protein DL98DRAFT_567840 [Cadophora sp. DSE1049]|nr:hypothetical protein DL98DRAFT_567840 [Cadophora sp. DSE1049]
MKLLSVLALVAAALRSISALRFTNTNFNNITIGEPFNLTWSDASGPVEITLLKGATPAFFASAGNLTSTFHMWTPSTDLYRDVYDIVFKDGTNVPVYSFQFEILGGRIAGTSIPTSSSSATSAAPSYTATFAYPPLGSLGGS